jgi:hypothetical protein
MMMILMSAKCRLHSDLRYSSSHLSYKQVFPSPHLILLPPYEVQWVKNMYTSMCYVIKVHEVHVCKVRAVLISIHQGICCGEWPYSCGVCNRSLSCKDILNDLLHISQVYIYLHLTRLRHCYCGYYGPFGYQVYHNLVMLLVLVQPLKFVYLPK